MGRVSRLKASTNEMWDDLIAIQRLAATGNSARSVPASPTNFQSLFRPKRQANNVCRKPDHL